jgi:DnaD/phage-associated family protein
MKEITLIDAFRAFDMWEDTQELSVNQRSLYFSILQFWNKTGRKEWFDIPNVRLELKSGIERRTLSNVRNQLKEMALIDFEIGNYKKNISPKYHLVLSTTFQVFSAALPELFLNSSAALPELFRCSSAALPLTESKSKSKSKSKELDSSNNSDSLDTIDSGELVVDCLDADCLETNPLVSESLDVILKFIENSIGGTISPANLESIKQLVASFGFEETQKAFEIAVSRKAKNIYSYAFGVLKKQQEINRHNQKDESAMSNLDLPF